MKPRTLLTLALASSMSLAVGGASAVDCVGDVSGDGVVGFTDLVTLLSDWGCTVDCVADIDNDGVVDFTDLVALLDDWGCQSPTNPTTTVSGVVTNLWTGNPIEGAVVTIGGDSVLTDAAGIYTGDFFSGVQDVLIESGHYISFEDEVLLFPFSPYIIDTALEPVAPVIIDVEFTGDAVPGGTVTATATATIMDGSTLETYTWTQIAGAPVSIFNEFNDIALLTLGGTAGYKEMLLAHLTESPLEPDEYPEWVPLPEGEFLGGLQNRFEIVGLNPLALEEAGVCTMSIDVQTSSGVYTGVGDVHTAVPWKPGLGLENVPLNVPVLVQGKEQAVYNWNMVAAPGSLATLTDPTGRYPEFVPDVAGMYTLTVTDTEASELVTIDVFAGNYRGIIVGQDGDGRPFADAACVGCHTAQGLDNFTPWAASGHAEIFTNNLDNSTHYGTNCFACHGVGYDPDNDNNGWDEQPDFLAFLSSGMLNNPGDNWTNMLELFPDSARMANIQCENCHGPQDGEQGIHSEAHMTGFGPRADLSSDICASCHGEPMRHARFQQWQLSGHSNYELAIDEGSSGNCSRCHTANGFLAWMPVLTGEVPGNVEDSVEVTWAPGDVHPQTCATCHDPHDIGTTTGIDTDAKMRLTEHTPPLLAGFTAYGVGRGAICMTCHNSKRGLRNDSNFDEHYGTSEATRAPHGPTQADMLMGQSAYLVDTGIRGNHSFVTDSCVDCHMERTPPPEALSHNGGGTNHTFYADVNMCVDCHGDALNADTIQTGIQDALDILEAYIGQHVINLMADQIALGNTIDLNGLTVITDAADVQGITFGSYHGRQAINVTLVDQTNFGLVSVRDVDVVDSGGVVLGGIYDFANPELIKAGWNWNMVMNDGSLGIHNPTYAYLVISNAIDALDGYGPAPAQMPAWLDLKRY